MKIAEIVLGAPDGGAARVDPRPEGLTIVPIEGDPHEAARAVREALSRPRREATTATVPFVRVRLEGDDLVLVIADDAVHGARMLEESRGGRIPFLVEASTQLAEDDAALELIAARAAAAFGAEDAAQLGPALSQVEPKPATQLAVEASPKELAYRRAHARAAALARQVRAIDDQMTASVVPGWLFVASAVGALGVLMTAVTLYNPDLRVIVIPAMMALLVLGLAAYALRAFRELRVRASLQTARAELREQREAARAEARALEATLRAKGVDPDELLARAADHASPPDVPAVIARNDAGDLTALDAAGRQVILFVPAAAAPADAPNVRRPRDV